MSLSLTLVFHIPYFCLFQRHLSTLKGLLLTIMNVLGSLLDMGSGIIVSKTEPVLFPFGVDAPSSSRVYTWREMFSLPPSGHTPVSISCSFYTLAEIKVSCGLCSMPSPLLNAPIRAPFSTHAQGML